MLVDIQGAKVMKKENKTRGGGKNISVSNRRAIPEYIEGLERYAIIEYIDVLYERLTYLLYSRFQKQRRTAAGTPLSGED